MKKFMVVMVFVFMMASTVFAQYEPIGKTFLLKEWSTSSWSQINIYEVVLLDIHDGWITYESGGNVWIVPRNRVISLKELDGNNNTIPQKTVEK